MVREQTGILRQPRPVYLSFPVLGELLSVGLTDSFLRVQENCKPAPVDAFFFSSAGKFAAIIASGRRKAPNEKRGSTFIRDNSSEKLKHNLLPETFIRFLPGSFPQKL